MTPTIQTFSRALLTPDLCLASLSGAIAETDPTGLPHLVRTTRFAEARIRWQGRQWLLSMPLTPVAMLRINRMVTLLRRLNTESLADYRILTGELRWQDSAGEEQRCDLVLQHLPEGRDFTEALLSESKSTLLEALSTLETELRRVGFTHHNLKAENLRWSGGRFIPLRYHDAEVGQPSESDAAAFAALRQRIAESTEPTAVSDTDAAYNPLRPLTGHRWMSNISEGLICVEDAEGFGYVDPQNNPVIAPQFLWADDFHEGRAEVETPTGMGLIDQKGHYIIAPEYEIIDYKPAKSVALVRQGGHWALFDYLGHRLTEFREPLPEWGEV